MIVVFSGGHTFIVSGRGLSSSFWLLFLLPFADQIISLAMQHFFKWNIGVPNTCSELRELLPAAYL